MGETEAPTVTLDEARAATAARRWQRARELFEQAATARPLGPHDLELLAKATYWTGDAVESIQLREAAYEANLERGDNARAAFCALTLQRQHASMLQESMSAAWLTRAERLLVAAAESPAHGYLSIAYADAARARGDVAQALSLVERAGDTAERVGAANLRAWALMRRGMFLVDAGRLDEGWPLLEDVAAAATGGELGAFTTGAALSNVVTMCHDLGYYRRGGEWSEAAMRWCRRQSIRGFPGICRTNHGAILGALGRLDEAEAELRAAVEELLEFSPVHAGAALHELGEVLLRSGDLAGADEAFRRARELGEDPQPGLALLRLAQGDAGTAAAAIRRSLELAAFDRFARARMLPAQVEIAGQRGDLATARAARNELAEIADQVPSLALGAAAEWASALLALLEGGEGSAAGHLRAARKGWTDVGAPFEAAKAAVALAELPLSGEDADALAGLRAARDTFDRLGARLELRRATDLLARAGHEAEPARAVRTFLFTDIVGSTALIEVIGDDAWEDLRRWHYQTLRASFAEHGGEEIDHAGDGFFVAFADAAAAVTCAVEIQRRLAEHRRTHGFSPQVRMGLHAASATRGDIGYGGIGVHTASRIASLAGGAEILASAETVEALPRIATSDRRTVRLKGIAEPVDVLAIDWRSTDG